MTSYNAHHTDAAGRLHATRSTELVGRWVDARGFFDWCFTDGEHLARPETPGVPCHVGVGALLPEKARERRGKWRVTITFVEE